MVSASIFANRAPSRKPDEGQAVVESVIGLLLVTMCAVGLLTLILAAFSINSVNAAIQSASWDVSPGEVVAAADPDEHVRQAMLARTPGLADANMEVSNTTVTTRQSNESSPVQGDRTELALSKITSKRDTARIEFDVTYAIPGRESLHVTRHVSHDLLVRAQSEVS